MWTLDINAAKLFRTLVFGCALLFVAACKTELHTNLDERDANEILSSLLQRGVSASKVIDKEGVSVFVDADQFAEAVEILRSLGLPKAKFRSVNDVFQSEGLVASPLQEWARLNYAKAQELSNTISSISGVVRADVHLGEARRESPFDEVEPPSASILVQMDRTMLREELVPEIKQLVALAHPDIKYENVGVVISPVTVSDMQIEFLEAWGILVHASEKQTIHILVLYCFLMTVFSIVVSTLAYLQYQKNKAAA